MRRELRSQSHDETPLLGMPRPRETNSCSNKMRWPKRGQESGLCPGDSICIRKGLHPIPITKTQKPSQSTSKHPPERTPTRTDAKTAKGSKTAQQQSSPSTGHRVSKHRSLHPTVNTAKTTPRQKPAFITLLFLQAASCCVVLAGLVFTRLALNLQQLSCLCLPEPWSRHGLLLSNSLRTLPEQSTHRGRDVVVVFLQLVHELQVLLLLLQLSHGLLALL